MRYAGSNMGQGFEGATTRQKLAADILVDTIEKGKAVQLKRIMRKAGYSEAVAKYPGKNLTRRAGFQDYLQEKLNDKMLIDKHAWLIDNATKEETQLNAVKLGYLVRGIIQNQYHKQGNQFNIANVTWGGDVKVTQNNPPTIDVQAESTQNGVNA